MTGKNKFYKLAFPDPIRGGEQGIMNQTPYNEDDGMQLIDFFASKVISKIVEFESDNFKMIHSNSVNKQTFYDNCAKIAYDIAEAMMRVREEKLI